MCENEDIPTAYELFHGTSYLSNILILLFGLLFFGVTLAVYIELIVFVNKHFKAKRRKARTIWILAVYPVFSCCGLLGVLIPRASTIIDLVSDVFLASCMYQFMGLMLDYIGDLDVVWVKLKDNMVNTRSPPVCCCCFCFPKVKVTRKNVRYFTALVLQLIISRPILSFIAAVMWADGVYIPGYIAAENAYVYIAVISLASSCTAVWGLTLIRRAFDPLLITHSPGRKFIPLQCVMLLTIIPNLFINFLVNQGAIPCFNVLPSKARGDRIYHGWLILLMVPLSFLSRHFYRNYVDGLETHHSRSSVKASQSSISAVPTCKASVAPYPLENGQVKENTDAKAVSNGVQNVTRKKDMYNCQEFKNLHHESWSTYV